MEIKPLAQMLEDLLYDASDAGLEACLAEAVCEPGMDWASVRAEYDHRYQRAVAVVAELRGEPSFVGPRGAPGFPSWLNAEHGSCWSDAAGIVYLALRNGHETIAMVGGGRPHPVTRDAVTLLPPAN